MILFRPLPLTLTPTNLVFIARFVVMMWTIVSHYIYNWNKANHKHQMPITTKVLGRARRGKVWPTKVSHQTNSHYEKSCPLSQPHFGQVWRWNSHPQSWGLGVLRGSWSFRVRQQGAKHLALGCSWCHWKGLEV
jgi:hypothetical protein